MAEGSACTNCGFKTDKIMLSCPRCRQPLQHEQCRQCGRCPVPPSEKQQK
ncbi:MAG: hypothetical protein SCK29_04940 [Bacillota bacterium]|nr:hypothetical protein [Bacillota bacterium]MDW7683451.1 hypothetical protein [Bacillota bacterium]